MKKTGPKLKKNAGNRRLVGKDIPTSAEGISEISPVEMEKVIQELHIHQVELEMQNEQLRQAQIEATEAREKYADLYDFAPIGYFIFDEKARILETNVTGASLLGSEKRSLTGQHFHRFVTPEHFSIFRSHLQKAHELRSKQNCKLKLAGKDGGFFDAQIDTIAVMDSDGNFDHYRSSVTDITEITRAEEALLKIKEKNQTILESITDIYMSFDHDWRFVDLNRQAESVLGKERKELIGKFVWEVFPQMKEREFFQQYQTAMATQSPVHFEALSTDGRWYETHAYPAEDGLSAYFRDITERKRAEMTLNESEERYRYLVKHAPTGIYEVDFAVRKFLSVNDVMCQYTGYTREEFISLDPVQLLTEESLKSFIQRHAKVLAGEPVPDSIEFQIKRKNGSLFWVILNVQYSYEPNNRIIAMVIAHDITERKQAEEALRESESRLKKILDSVQTGVIIIDTKTHIIVDANPSAVKMFGGSKEQIIGSICHNFICPAEKDQCPITDFGQTIDNSERTLITAERERRPIVKTVVGMKFGGKDYLVESFIDISDRKKKETELRGAYEHLAAAEQQLRAQYDSLTESERALRESEEKYRFITERMSDVIWTLDSRFGVQYVTPSVLKALGFTPEERAKLTIFERITPESFKKVEEALAFEMQRDRESDVDPDRTATLELEYYHKNGSIVWHETLITGIRDVEGNIIGFHGASRDITERKKIEKESKRLEERLRRAEKMEALGILAGGVAHDLNNVLGIVVGYAEMLLMDADKSSSIRPSLMNIMDGGQRAAAIVQDLLTLARRGVPSRNVLNLNKIIVDCQQSPEFERLSSYHSAIRIETDIEPDLLNISGSPVHLGKTLFNLVSNASEAMPRGGIVTIKTANEYLDKPIQGYDEVREGDYVVLSVSDTGEGIPTADLKRIFEPFYTKKVMGRSGTGLGLAVVWGTVKDHNGYIDVQSEEGKGSTFTLYFPASRLDISSEAAAIPISEYMGKGESILIVDDVKGQRDLAAGMLRKLNYNVSSVSSGEEAIAYVKEHKIDLIVLDMIMDPGMDGLGTYRSILEIHPQQRAIIVSGFSETDRVITAQTLGAGAYVRKPYILEKLGLAVRKELDRK